MSLVYFDVNIGGSPAGRMVFRLFDSIVPRTSMNFKCLCTGERGVGSTTGKNLSYENTIFHRVIAGFMCQGGDFSKRDGTGGESIYGGKFADESFRVKHTKYGQLSMANAGPNTNGSQFFITFGSTPHLDGKHVVFGEIVEGVTVLNRIEKVDTGDRDRPVFGQEVQITACGVIGERKEEARASSKRNLDEIHEALNSEQTTDKRHKKERKDKKEKKEKKSKKVSKKHKMKSGKSSKKSKKRRYSSSGSSSDSSSSGRDDDSSVGSQDSAPKHASKKESRHAEEDVVAKHSERTLDAEDGEVLDTSAIMENGNETMDESRERNDRVREPEPVQPARVDADGVVCKGRGMIKYRDGPANGNRRNGGGFGDDKRGDRDGERGGNRWDRSRDQREGGDRGRATRERYVPMDRSYDRDRSRAHSRSRSRSRSRSTGRARYDPSRADGERRHRGEDEQVEGSEKVRKAPRVVQKVDKVDKAEKEQLSVAERMQRPLGGSR